MNNSDKIETKKNTSKGDTVHTYCNQCENYTNHQVITDYCKSEITDYTVNFKADYQIVKCSGCDTVSYRSFYSFSEYQNIDDDGTWEERFPVSKTRMEKNFEHLPSVLSQIYKEVIIAYNNGSFLLCAAGIRAILEGVCKNENITGKNLKEKIENLYEHRFVSQQHKNILHSLRFLGNAALHELQEPIKKEIEAALDIIEHIIESLYEIVKKGELIKKDNGVLKKEV